MVQIEQDEFAAGAGSSDCRLVNNITPVGQDVKGGEVVLKCSPKVGQKLCGKAILNSVLDRT